MNFYKIYIQNTQDLRLDNFILLSPLTTPRKRTSPNIYTFQTGQSNMRLYFGASGNETGVAPAAYQITGLGFSFTEVTYLNSTSTLS